MQTVALPTPLLFVFASGPSSSRIVPSREHRIRLAEESADDLELGLQSMRRVAHLFAGRSYAGQDSP